MKIQKLNISQIKRVETIPPDKAFVEDIRQNGLLVPIIVTSKKEDGLHHVIAGRRRLAACTEIGLGVIDAIVIEEDLSRDEIAILTIKENEMRSSNILSDMEAIDILMGLGYQEQEICKLTGMSQQTFQKRLKTWGAGTVACFNCEGDGCHLCKDGLRKTDEFFRAVIDGNMSYKTLEAVAKMTPRQRLKVLDILREKGKLKSTDLSEIREQKYSNVLSEISQFVDDIENEKQETQIPFSYIVWNNNNAVLCKSLKEAREKGGKIYQIKPL